jgi:hypothetical protein
MDIVYWFLWHFKEVRGNKIACKPKQDGKYITPNKKKIDSKFMVS